MLNNNNRSHKKSEYYKNNSRGVQDLINNANYPEPPQFKPKKNNVKMPMNGNLQQDDEYQALMTSMEEYYVYKQKAMKNTLFPGHSIDTREDKRSRAPMDIYKMPYAGKRSEIEKPKGPSLDEALSQQQDKNGDSLWRWEDTPVKVNKQPMNWELMPFPGDLPPKDINVQPDMSGCMPLVFDMTDTAGCKPKPIRKKPVQKGRQSLNYKEQRDKAKQNIDSRKAGRATHSLSTLGHQFVKNAKHLCDTKSEFVKAQSQICDFESEWSKADSEISDFESRFSIKADSEICDFDLESEFEVKMADSQICKVSDTDSGVWSLLDRDSQIVDITDTISQVSGFPDPHCVQPKSRLQTPISAKQKKAQYHPKLKYENQGCFTKSKMPVTVVPQNQVPQAMAPQTLAPKNPNNRTSKLTDLGNVFVCEPSEMVFLGHTNSNFFD